VKRAAALAAALVRLVLVIVGVALLALWAAGTLSQSVPGHATPAPVPATAQPVDATSYIGQHADTVSADLRHHGFTAVTYRTNGGEIPFGIGCAPFTVVDEVYTQLSTKTASITHAHHGLGRDGAVAEVDRPERVVDRCTVPAAI
jgi:hypothetical protein